jgi:hypothetical protein
MRRWLALPVLALLAVTACGNKDDVEGADEQPVATDEVGTAVDIARLSLPATLDDRTVGELIRDLCSAAGTGDIDPVVAQLVASGVATDQLPSSVDALAAGAGTYCPDDVDDVVPQVQQALAPAPPTTAATAEAVAGAGGTGRPGGSARSSSSASSSGGSGSGGTSTQSSGSASAGGGNASGTGNQSSTGFSQGVSSSSGSSGGSSAGSSGTTG